MVEYIDQNILKLRWQVSNDSENLAPFDYRSEYVISGSKKFVSIWQFLDLSTTFEQLPIIEVAKENIEGPVSQVQLIGNRAFVSTKYCSVFVYDILEKSVNEKSLQLVTKRNGLHSNYLCNDMLFCPQTNSVITCGEDGTICHFDIDLHKAKFSTCKVCPSPIRCIDQINPNELLCGTLTGSLIHYDLRSEKIAGTFSSKLLSTLTSVAKNPNVNHLAISGNDDGIINWYDLRREHSAVAKIPAHDAAITRLTYKPRDPETIYSSSCDGVLLRWNIYSDFNTDQKPIAESLISGSDCFSINCFDVNQNGHLIYTTDQDAIHYLKTDKLAVEHE